ncbi:large exoprotein [Sulfuriferula multivorans]|uniref:Large exoprotein n=1 Tax=Sulfuriferula multivorans TaxID=1559896 RepID=A0A401JER1_9PROT|nr:filamentous hemagglutinin N-terminal domain-containing protein [Sulfuriferula multivorans]GBL46111.1 large exoprotein [Sulfuriferula multivorans]
MLQWPVAASANPDGAQVLSGQVNFKTLGSQLDIHNTPGAIINWNGFSIDANEITRFIQQSASSAVLNRVIGQDPSRILGALLSNGRVFLINPNGIVFAAGARIDTAGLVASTLNLSDQDFAAGRLRFSANPNTAAIDNAAVINTTSGGQVYLIAPDINNSGLINAPQGQIVLAAGRSVELLDPASPNVRVAISAPGGQALNLGQLVATSGHIGIYATLIDQRGIVNADSATQAASGQIVLRASGDIHLHDASLISASGAADSQQDGGAVQIVAGGKLDLARGAKVAVDGGGLGGNGGSLELSGMQLSLLGDYSGQAHTPGYQNGSLLLDPAYINVISGGTDTIPSSGIVDNTLSPNTFNIDPASLANGSWSTIQLAASTDITVSSPIPSLGAAHSLSLSAGRDINLNADLGTSGQPLAANVNLSAMHLINLGSSVYLDSSYTLNLDGTTQVSATSQLSAGNLLANSVVLLNGAALLLNAPATIDTLQLNDGTLNNRQPLSINTLNWSGGVLQPDQPVNVNTQLNIFGTPMLVGGNLTSHGTASMGGSANLTLSQGTVLTNAPGARFVVNDPINDGNNNHYAISQSGSPSSFINQGTLQNTNPGGRTTIGVGFVNDGSLQNDFGTFDFSGPVSGGGVFNTASGATLIFSGIANLPAPTNLVGGTVVFASSSKVLFSPSAGAMLGSSTLIPVSGSSGPLTIDQIVQPAHGNVINNGNGTLRYIPSDNFIGTDTFTYQLNASGGSALAQQTVLVSSNQVSVAPIVEVAPAVPFGLDNSLLIQTSALSTTPSLLSDAQKGNHNARSSCN